MWFEDMYRTDICLNGNFQSVEVGEELTVSSCQSCAALSSWWMLPFSVQSMNAVMVMVMLANSVLLWTLGGGEGGFLLLLSACFLVTAQTRHT